MSKSKLSVTFVVFCFIVFEASAIPDPREAANNIFTTVNARRTPEEIKQNKQFAYLYFQRKTDNDIVYTNKDVQRILAGATNERLPDLVGQKPWPQIDPADNPRSTHTSNMRVAGARLTPDEPDSNAGHSEQKMLLDFDDMIRGVFGWANAELKECPAFIILGTRLFPCWKGLTVGCGQDFVKKTKSVLDQCCKTDEEKKNFLYIYSGDDAGQSWNQQRKKFERDGIQIITGSD